MTDAEIITKACIVANPEIVELKFGCAVMVSDKYGERLDIIGSFKPIEEMGELANKKIIETIGRPIRLADVLLAIGKSYDHRARGYRVRMNGEAEFEVMGKAIDTPQGWFGWNLKETLENQSEPTKKFVAELLKKDG